MREIPTTVKNKELVKKRRRQIVLAAIKLFSKNGYHKTTLKELAEEAGLSHGNVYDYVGSKEDIFFLIHDFVAGAAIEMLNTSVENVHDPIDKLRRMVRGEFSLMDQWADAVLLIYQESHILKGDFLKRLLEKERAHLEKFELVIKECVTQSKFKDCNVHLVANLIKSMVDTITLKRWDLRRYSTSLELEQLILDLLFNGLSFNEKDHAASIGASDSLMGKTALVVNAGTVLGQAISTALLAQGIKLIMHVDTSQNDCRHIKNPGSQSAEILCCTLEQKEPLTPHQLRKIEKEHGPIEIYIHDLGIGTTDKPADKKSRVGANPFEENMRCAYELAGYFKNQMAARKSGRIIFLSPWSWDQYTDPICFATARAGAAALSKTMAKQMASNNVNVNCIVPGYIRAARPLNIEEQTKGELLKKIPSGRMGEVFDVTEAIRFFIGDSAKYATGQVFNVAGGLI